MELAILVGLIVFMSSMFGLWAGARYNPLCVERYVKRTNPDALPARRRSYDEGYLDATLEHIKSREEVPTLSPVQFMRDPVTGRFVKT